MPIDFHDPANARTYSGRDADPTWGTAAVDLVDPRGLRVVDVGCGGGVYSRAWLRLGAAHVVGVDSSAPILVFARALIHHVPDLGAVVREAYRLLTPGGSYLVQDRTMADIDQPAGTDHVRGLVLEVFPRLRDVEAHRRPDPDVVRKTLRRNGFHAIRTASLWETRRRYRHRDDYLDEIATRTGRSILHDLDDAELASLVDALRARLPDGPLVERSRWTVRCAERPVHGADGPAS